MGGYKSMYYSLLKKKKFNLTSHSIADADGVCSAILINSLFPQSKIIFLDNPSHIGRRICEKYNVKYSTSSNIKPQDTVLVDVSDPALLKGIKGKFFGIVDHHTTNNVVKCENSLVSQNVPSTTHLVYEIMKSVNIVPSAFQAELILIGIISDTYRFKSVGSSSLFKEVSYLLSLTKNDYKSIVSILESKMSFSERITFMRSFGKVYSIYRQKKTQNIFVITDTDSFTSLVSTGIVDSLGADVSFAYAIMDEHVVISMRTSSNIKIHSGEFLKELGKKYSGEGGGHIHAAGCKLNKKYFSKMESILVGALSKHFDLEKVEM